ncbi:glutathione S-transferase family protein [Shewanella surugensis]|uniref:Glutathione S-transferase family protein n=1 Tax=Shewanella surugensis TaxID=212020 RepID=A0ABT0LJ17_9GAMM|nr:glutathione S-transferase family protein [Shewanella surugensis]MCL1127708.1 glutathione S-transferase family protein [Shewanella surugensis]
MKDEIILYEYEGSPCVRRVKITLIEKGLTFKTQSIDLSRMQQKSQEYLSINPNGVVPTLSHNARMIYESSVINEYLEDQFPTNALYPSTIAGLAEVKKWQNVELALAKVCRTLAWAYAMGPLQHISYTREEYIAIAAKTTTNTGHLNWSGKVWDLAILSTEEQKQHQNQLIKFIDFVESSLQDKHYLLGALFSNADILLYPRLTMLSLVGININQLNYPNLQAWIKRVAARPSIQLTHNKSMDLLYNSGLIEKINHILYSKKKRTIQQSLYLWGMGKICRKKFKVKQALQEHTEGFNKILLPTKGMATQPSKVKRKALYDVQVDNHLTLYSYKDSPLCSRVKLVLAILELPYTNVEINMVELDHKRKPFTHLNPAAELPILKHGENLIFDSQFIVEYLCYIANNLQLFSQDSYEQAQIKMWNAFDLGMLKEYRPLFFDWIMKKDNGSNKVVKESTNNELPKEDQAWFNHMRAGTLLTDTERQGYIEIFSEKMSYLDNHLNNNNYLVTDRFTYADIVLYTRIVTFNALGLGKSVAHCKNIEKWMTHIAEQLASPSSASC